MYRGKGSKTKKSAYRLFTLFTRDVYYWGYKHGLPYKLTIQRFVCNLVILSFLASLLGLNVNMRGTAGRVSM